jgi:hypothetical protein
MDITEDEKQEVVALMDEVTQGFDRLELGEALTLLRVNLMLLSVLQNSDGAAIIVTDAEACGMANMVVVGNGLLAEPLMRFAGHVGTQLGAAHMGGVQ